MFPIKWESNEKREKPFYKIPYDFMKKIYDHFWENLKLFYQHTNTKTISDKFLPL